MTKKKPFKGEQLILVAHAFFLHEIKQKVENWAALENIELIILV